MPWTVWIVPAAVWSLVGIAFLVTKFVKGNFDRPFVWIVVSMVNAMLMVIQILLVINWYHTAGACERFSKSANVETKVETYGFYKGRTCFVNMGDGTWVDVENYKGVNVRQ